MALKQYNVVTHSYAALPRSKRLRDRGIGSNNKTGSSIVTTSDSHAIAAALTEFRELFDSMFCIDEENTAIQAKLSLYSLGGITAGGVGTAGDGSVGSGIAEVTASMIVEALGYIPYNAANPSGYITVSALSEYALKSNIPTQLSQLTDNVGYALAAAIPTALSQLTNDAYYLRGYNTTETSFTDNRTIGVYRYGSGVANKDGAPAGATDYGNLVVFRGDIADTLVQLYFNYNDDKIFVRSTNSEGIKNNTKGWQTLAYVSNIPTDNSQLNNGAGYSTKSWVNDKLVAYTPLITVQGYDSRITGLEGALPDLQNRVTVVEQLAQGTDAALINYALKTEIPTLANGYGRGGVLHSSDIGYAEVGIALDFHRLADDNVDYWTRLRVGDSLTRNTVYLPGASGTLAITTQIPTQLSQLTDNVGYVTIAGDQTITGAKVFSAPISKPIDSSAAATSNYISAGGGYSVNSGKYGVKLLCCDQSDCQTGLGQDLAGLSGGYELSVAGGTSASGYGYISFVSHPVNSTAYRRLGYFHDNGGFVSFNVDGTINANKFGNIVTACGASIVDNGTYVDWKHPSSGLQLQLHPDWTVLGYNNADNGKSTYIDGTNVIIRTAGWAEAATFNSNGLTLSTLIVKGASGNATLKMDGSSLSIDQELKLIKGGSSDICTGIATAFKANLAQTTNLIANKIIMGTNSGQASTLPIEFCKYTSISDTAPSGLTTLMSLDTNGNLDVKSLTIGGITLSVENGALKINGNMVATGSIAAGA